MTAASKIGALSLVTLLMLQACIGRDPAPSRPGQPLATVDGFSARLDSLVISEGPPRSVLVQLTMWNKSEQVITIEAKGITVVDAEGRSAVGAAELYVVDQSRLDSAVGVVGGVVGTVLFCVVLLPVCAVAMIVSSVARPIREAGRHRPAVIVRSGGDETVSVSLAENSVRFDYISTVRITRRNGQDYTLELPINDTSQKR